MAYTPDEQLLGPPEVADHGTKPCVATLRWLDVLTRIVVDVGETSVVELELSRFPRVHGGLSCPTLMPG